MGVIDTNSRNIIPCQYEKIKFDCGFFLVKDQNGWGIQRDRNLIIVQCKYDDVKVLNGCYFCICNDKKWGVIDDCGSTIADCEYDEIQLACPQAFKMKLNNKWGLILLVVQNLELRKNTIECNYDEISVHWQYFVLRTNSECSILNRSGTINVQCEEYEKFDGGFTVKNNEGMWGAIVGNTIIACEYNEIKHHEKRDNHYFIVQKSEKWGLITSTGLMLVDCIHDEIRIRGRGLFCVDGGKEKQIHNWLNR